VHDGFRDQGSRGIFGGCFVKMHAIVVGPRPGEALDQFYVGGLAVSSRCDMNISFDELLLISAG